MAGLRSPLVQAGCLRASAADGAGRGGFPAGGGDHAGMAAPAASRPVPGSVCAAYSYRHQKILCTKGMWLSGLVRTAFPCKHEQSSL